MTPGIARGLVLFGAAGLGLALFSSGCDGADGAVVVREHRFGIFRDLVLFQRPLAEGGPFFLDRFESTVEDFRTWKTGVLALDRYPNTRPKAGVDLHEARRFARWRFCRVPRANEWTYACTQAGTYIFPWGNNLGPTLANTGKLGLGRTTPVGSFASGGGKAGPFDLVGNVAEWTETVAVPFSHLVPRTMMIERVIGLPEWPSFDPPAAELSPYEQAGAMPLGLRLWLPLWAPMPDRWLHGGNWDSAKGPVDEPAFEFTERRLGTVYDETLDMPGIDRYRSMPGLNCWLPNWCPAPTDWLVELESGDLKREILGGHFRSLVLEREVRGGHHRSRVIDNDEEPPGPRQWQPGQRDPTTGVRLAADPAGLLTALLEYEGDQPDRAALATLRRFLRWPGNRAVLSPVWPRVLRRTRGGALRQFLIGELGGG